MEDSLIDEIVNDVKTEIPRMFFTTHFHEIFSQNLLNRSEATEFYKMEIFSDPKNNQDNDFEEMVFMYKFNK